MASYRAKFAGGSWRKALIVGAQVGGMEAVVIPCAHTRRWARKARRKRTAAGGTSKRQAEHPMIKWGKESKAGT